MSLITVNWDNVKSVMFNEGKLKQLALNEDTLWELPYVYRTILDRSISGAYVNDSVESVGDYAFAYCSKLTSVDFPLVTSIGTYAFNGCSALTSVNFPLVTSIGTYAFYNCKVLTTVNFPLVTSIGNSAFWGCSALTAADFPLVTSIGNSAFYNCSALTALILRSEIMATLSGTNAFTSTPIASGTGYIYVPSALMDNYKSATNWSTYANQIRAIEDYPDVSGGEE